MPLSVDVVLQQLRSAFPDGGSITGDPQARFAQFLTTLINTNVLIAQDSNTAAINDLTGRIGVVNDIQNQLSGIGTIEQRVSAIEAQVNVIQAQLTQLSTTFNQIFS